MLPMTPTLPVLSTSNAIRPVLIRFRNSWARNPRRSVPRAVSYSSVDWLLSRPYSVTAPAIASPRHRFSARKSSVPMVARVSTASWVIAWKTSP